MQYNIWLMDNEQREPNSWSFTRDDIGLFRPGDAFTDNDGISKFWVWVAVLDISNFAQNVHVSRNKPKQCPWIGGA